MKTLFVKTTDNAVIHFPVENNVTLEEIIDNILDKKVKWMYGKGDAIHVSHIIRMWMNDN